MLIQKSTIEARVFNLDDAADCAAYNQVINNPSVRILEKKFIAHTEVEQMGKDRTEVKENHIHLEWETCSL